MNPTKLKLQRALAISSIVGGAIIFILMTVELILMLDRAGGYYTVGNFLLVGILPLLLTLAIAVLGGIFFKEKS